jgi:transposase
MLEVVIMLTERADTVIGVDTHAERHAFCLIDARSGLVLGERELPATRAGYREALRLARLGGPGKRVWAVEGTGSYGSGLACFLAARGERLLEVERPQRRGRDGRLKSDRLDAERAARAVLSGDKLATPRCAGEREALRLLLAAREQDVAVRRDGLNQLRALLVTAPAQLRERLARLPRGTLVRSCLRLRRRPDAEPALAACLLALRSCAERVAQASARADKLEREITRLVRTLCPQLLAQPGVGPISAGSLLVAWSHKGRLHSEAAFARLAGVAPIPASSGKTSRHRLDRGGDRKLNRALHTILLSRRRTDPDTIAYIERRLNDGKTEREAIRCLKRYLARSLYRLLEKHATTA